MERAYAAAARAPATQASCRYDFRAIVAWCDAHAFAPMPASPDTVALCLTFLAETGWKALTNRPGPDRDLLGAQDGGVSLVPLRCGRRRGS